MLDAIVVRNRLLRFIFRDSSIPGQIDFDNIINDQTQDQVFRNLPLILETKFGDNLDGKKTVYLNRLDSCAMHDEFFSFKVE